MTVTSDKSKPTLRNNVVKKAKASSKGGDAGTWSARKAQLAVQEYKSKGGGYVGKKSSDNSLAKRTKQDRGTKSGKTSKETGERYMPAKAIKKISSSQYAASSKAKKAGGGVGSVVKNTKAVTKVIKKYSK